MVQARSRGGLFKRVFSFFIVCGSFPLVVFLVIFTAFVHSAFAQQVTLAWNPNTEADLGGYRVYSGTASRTYPNISNVGNSTNCTISGLTAGSTYYFAVTAYDNAGNEGGYSNEVTYTVPTTPPPTSQPQELVISATPYISWYLGAQSTRMLYAQSFKAMGPKIGSVAVALARYRSPNMPVRVSIRTAPGGSILASAQILPSQVTSTDYRNPSWINLTFSSPLTVTQGSRYYLVLDVTTHNYNNYYRVPMGKNVYTDGTAYQSALTVRSDVDLVCRLTFGQQ